MKLKTLSIMTSVLFAISLFVYSNENRRGTDLLEGSEFIKGIDVNSIQKIKISQGTKNISFSRDGNRFVLDSHKSYPASSERLNNLIFSISNILIQEKVESNASEDDLKDYRLSESDNQNLVEFFDKNDKKTLAFRVGKNHRKRGTYLLKEGTKDVYLSKNNVYINSSHKDFIDQLILKVSKSDVAEIITDNSDGVKIVQKDNKFQVMGPEGKIQEDKKVKEDLLNKLTSSLSRLEFKDYYSREDGTISNLVFTERLKLKLENQLNYDLSLAQTKINNKLKHFVRVSADTGEMPTQVTVSQNDGKEELQKIEDMIKTQSLSQQFNLNKGNWIYEIDKSAYENLSRDLKEYL